MGDVVRLHAVGEPLATKEALAEWLRGVADAIAEGEYGEVDRMVLMTHSPNEGITIKANGGSEFTSHAVIGLIEIAKVSIIEDMP